MDVHINLGSINIPQVSESQQRINHIRHLLRQANLILDRLEVGNVTGLCHLKFRSPIEAVSVYPQDRGSVCCCYDYSFDVQLQNCVVHCVLMSRRMRVSTRSMGKGLTASMVNRGFAQCGTHVYAHNFAPLLGFLLYSAVWRKTTKHAIIWIHFITGF